MCKGLSNKFIKNIYWDEWKVKRVIFVPIIENCIDCKKCEYVCI